MTVEGIPPHKPLPLRKALLLLKHRHKGHQRTERLRAEKEAGRLEGKESTVQDGSHLTEPGRAGSRTLCTSFLATEKVTALSKGLFTPFPPCECYGWPGEGAERE